MKRRLCVLIVLLFAVILTRAGDAAVKEIQSRGRYVMGDVDSKKDAKKFALLEAKQMALEQAGTYLSTATEVRNFQLTTDEVTSLAAGVMSVEVLAERWTMEGENPVVTITIRAMVLTDHLAEQIQALQQAKRSVNDYTKLQTEVAALQTELARLKQTALAKERGQADPAVTRELARKQAYTMEQIDQLQHLEQFFQEKFDAQREGEKRRAEALREFRKRRAEDERERAKQRAEVERERAKRRAETARERDKRH